MLIASLQPPIEPTAILVKQKGSNSKTLPENAVRFGIARRARNPLLSNLILAGREPLLRQDFNQSRLQIENVQGERRVIVSFRRITRRNNQFIHRLQLGRNFKLMRSSIETERHLKLRDWRCRSVDSF